MCGAYGFTFKDKSAVYRRFNITNTLEDLEPRFNMRPAQHNPVIVSQSPNKILRMQWGIIRDWSTRPIINATAEKLPSSRLWRDLFRFKRCLVPASFFYEPDKSVSPSQPYLFRLASGDMFAIAGLYEEVKDEKTGEITSYYVLITTKPNSLVDKVHPRSAALLRREYEEDWLNPDIVEPEKLLPLLTPYPASEMVSFPVSKRVNSWKNDSEDLIQPL